MAIRVSTIKYTLTNNASPGLRQIARDAAAIRTAAESSAAALGRLEQKMTHTGKAGKTASGGMMGFLNQVSPVALTRVAVAAAGITALATAVVAVGASAIRASSQIEVYRARFETLLKSKSAGDQFVKMLRDFADVTPFSDEDAFKGAERLLNFGIDVKDIIPIMRDLGDAVGADSERFMRASIALGQMQAKGRASMEEVNQLAEAGIPAFAILEEQLGLTQKQMLNLGAAGIDSEKAIEALRRGIQQRFAGGMERASRTNIGLWSNVQAGINRTMAVLGEGLDPVVKEVFGNLLVMTRQAEAAMKSFVDTPAFKDFVATMIAIIPDVMAVMKALGRVLFQVGTLMLRWLSVEARKAQPVLKLLAVILNLVAGALAMINKLLDAFIQSLKRVWDWIRGIAQGLKDFLANLPGGPGGLIALTMKLFMDENGIGAAVGNIIKDLSGGGAIKIPLAISTTAIELLKMVAAIVLAVVAPPIGIPLMIAQGANLANQLKSVVDEARGGVPSVSIPTAFAPPADLAVRVNDVSIPTSYQQPAEMTTTPPVVKIPTVYTAPEALTITPPVVAIPTQFAAPAPMNIEPTAVTVGVQFASATLSIPTPATVVIPTEFGRPGAGGSGSEVWSGSTVGAGQGALVSGNGSIATPQPVILSVPAGDVVPVGVQSVVNSTVPGDPITQAFGLGLAVAGIAAVATLGLAGLAGTYGVITAAQAVAAAAATKIGTGGGCFAAGTPVLTPDGERAIETILVGERVFRWHPTSGALVVDVVTEALVHDGCPLLRVTLDGGVVLDVTPEHLFYDGAGWVPAGALTDGRLVLSGAAGGALVRVSTVEQLDGEHRVYNLHVAGDSLDSFDSHNYLVGGDADGAGGLVVHNFKTTGGAHAFAAGGIVTQPTRGLVGEAGPEAIIPLSQSGMQRAGIGGMMGGAGGGTTVHIHVAGGVYATREAMTELAGEIGRVFTREQRLAGSIALNRV